MPEDPTSWRLLNVADDEQPEERDPQWFPLVGPNGRLTGMVEIPSDFCVWVFVEEYGQFYLKTRVPCLTTSVDSNVELVSTSVCYSVSTDHTYTWPFFL